MRHTLPFILALVPIACGAPAAGPTAAPSTPRQGAPAAPSTPPPSGALGAQPKPHHGGTSAPQSTQQAAMCPMAVAGTSVRVEEAEGSVAMVFTTTGDRAELRRRVARMAAMHNLHHAEGGEAVMGGAPSAEAGAAQSESPGPALGGLRGRMGAGMASGGTAGGDTAVPPSLASSTDVPGGSRLVITPKHPEGLPTLRAHARRHADQMASGHCPMMKGHIPKGGQPPREAPAPPQNN